FAFSLYVLSHSFVLCRLGFLYLSLLLFFFLSLLLLFSSFFFFNDPAPTEIYTLSLHDALPIYSLPRPDAETNPTVRSSTTIWRRSEEHTSELQSRRDLVCRLLLEKKKNKSQSLQVAERRSERQVRRQAGSERS